MNQDVEMLKFGHALGKLMVEMERDIEWKNLESL